MAQAMAAQAMAQAMAEAMAQAMAAEAMAQAVAECSACEAKGASGLSRLPCFLSGGPSHHGGTTIALLQYGNTAI